MYKRRWSPSRSQRKEFAIKMQTDKEFADAYNARKVAREEKRRDIMSRSCNEPGTGLCFKATRLQHDFCIFDRPGNLTSEQEDACNFVASAYACNEPVDHFYLHIVAELMRRNNSNCHI